jgi:predicted lipid-binding transport protein (Tim44 family)
MAAANNNDLHDRPVGDLLKQLSEETTTLVKQEIDLAKAEMAEKGKQAGIGAGMFGGAGVSGLLALFFLSFAGMAALDTSIAGWLAALIVGVVWTAVAGVLALQGKNKVQEAVPPAPEQAIESTKEDVEWAKSQAQSART